MYAKDSKFCANVHIVSCITLACDRCGQLRTVSVSYGDTSRHERVLRRFKRAHARCEVVPAATKKLVREAALDAFTKEAIGVAVPNAREHLIKS